MNERPIPQFDPVYDMPITNDVRQILAESYEYTCQISGDNIRSLNPHIDHIYPRALGGRDNLENYTISSATANISKNANRLSETREAKLLADAKRRAPSLLQRLTELRSDTNGKAVNPLVVFAFRLIGAEVGTRVATGSYLRAKDGPASGAVWWGYFGPDKTNGLVNPTLQFGVKLFTNGHRHQPHIQALPGIFGRGNSVWYFPIEASLPLQVDRTSLKQAQQLISQACRG